MKLHRKKLDRFRALVIYGPSKTGKTHIARQLGAHLYFRGSINWDKWSKCVHTASFAVFDDIDWEERTKYPRDLQKALFSGAESFEKCTSDAFMRTLKMGIPSIIVMNDETPEEQRLLKNWREDPWKRENMDFLAIDRPLIKRAA